MSPEAKRKFQPLDKEVFKLMHDKKSDRIGKTIPEIAPFIPPFSKVYEGNSWIEEATAYSAIPEITEEGRFWRLALILKLKNGISKRQLKALEKMVPKEIPKDIPIVYEILKENE